MSLQHKPAITQKDNALTDVANIDSVPQWFKVTVGFAALSTAGVTNDIEILSLPVGTMIHKVVQKHSVAFAGPSITAMTISVGITGTLAKYGTALDVFQAVGATVFQLDSVVGIESFGAVTSIRAAGIATGANLDQLSAGSTDIYLLVSKP